MGVSEIQYGIVGYKLPYQPYDNDEDKSFEEIHEAFLNKHGLTCVSDGMDGKYTIVGRMIFKSDPYEYTKTCELTDEEILYHFADIDVIMLNDYEEGGIFGKLCMSEESPTISLHIFTHYT